ncbi:MAG: phosphoglycerate dehydrogenase [Planctomycetota bacterium]
MSETSFPRDRISVVFVEGVHGRAGEMFHQGGYTHVRSEPKALTGADLSAAVERAHVVGLRSKTKLTDGLIEAADRLLAVGCFCIGTDQVALEAARSKGVPVFNAPFSNTRSVAELTIAEIVMLQRRLTEKSRLMHDGLWDKSATGAHEVRGLTVGIVGYGHIGTQVSVLAEAMGMRVLFYDVVPKLALGNARSCESIEELLSASDIVTVHVPASPSTESLIGAEQIAHMRSGTHLINNARGKVVDIEAAADAIRTGKLGGGAFDVFPSEPKGRGEAFESPLRGVENVILTPHIGGSTEEAQEAIAQDVATKLLRFIETGSTTGAVNVPEVDLPPTARGAESETHRILHFHRNVPGVLGKLNALVSELNANVNAQHLQTDGDLGYVVLDVDASDGEALRTGLESIPETIRTRVLW